MNRPAPFELRILGAPDLRAPDGRRVTSVLSQPARLSLLAYLTLAPGPVTRAAIVAAFWPESDEAHARNALSQAVFYLRRSLGKDAVQSVEGDRLWVPPEQVWCDAHQLLTEAQPPQDVLAAAGRDLLAGWNADGSQPLQEWLDTQRRRVRERAAEIGSAGGQEAGGVEERPGAPTPRPAPLPRWILAAGAIGLAALVLIAVLPSLRPSSGGGTLESGTARLFVLWPRVTLSPGVPEVAAHTLNDELIARLPERARLEVVSASYATSFQDFEEQLRTISEPGEDVPEWILDVGVTVTDNSVHVVGLLYRGVDFSVRGRVIFDHPFVAADEFVLDVPRAIAERVVAMVEENIER